MALTRLPTISTSIEGDPFVAHMRELNCSMVRRAYELFREIASTDVHDFERWQTAVDEMLDGVSVHVTETHDQFSIDATLPGFTEEEIQIKVDPHRVLITGKHEETSGDQENEVPLSERGSKAILRECLLAGGIAPEKVTAQFNDGVLQICLPKSFANSALLVDAWPHRNRLRALHTIAGQEPYDLDKMKIWN